MTRSQIISRSIRLAAIVLGAALLMKVPPQWLLAVEAIPAVHAFIAWLFIARDGSQILPFADPAWESGETDAVWQAAYKVAQEGVHARTDGAFEQITPAESKALAQMLAHHKPDHDGDWAAYDFDQEDFADPRPDALHPLPFLDQTTEEAQRAFEEAQRAFVTHIPVQVRDFLTAKGLKVKVIGEHEAFGDYSPDSKAHYSAEDDKRTRAMFVADENTIYARAPISWSVLVHEVGHAFAHALSGRATLMIAADSFMEAMAKTWQRDSAAGMLLLLAQKAGEPSAPPVSFTEDFITPYAAVNAAEFFGECFRAYLNADDRTQVPKDWPHATRERLEALHPEMAAFLADQVWHPVSAVPARKLTPAEVEAKAEALADKLGIAAWAPTLDASNLGDDYESGNSPLSSAVWNHYSTEQFAAYEDARHVASGLGCIPNECPSDSTPQIKRESFGSRLGQIITRVLVPADDPGVSFFPAIEDDYRANFDTLLRAAKEGRLALLDVQEKATGKARRAIVAMSDSTEERSGFDIVPLALMFDSNPYDLLNPPNPDGEYFGADQSADQITPWALDKRERNRVTLDPVDASELAAAFATLLRRDYVHLTPRLRAVLHLLGRKLADAGMPEGAALMGELGDRFDTPAANRLGRSPAGTPAGDADQGCASPVTCAADQGALPWMEPGEPWTLPEAQAQITAAGLIRAAASKLKLADHEREALTAALDRALPPPDHTEGADQERAFWRLPVEWDDDRDESTR